MLRTREVVDGLNNVDTGCGLNASANMFNATPGLKRASTIAANKGDPVFIELERVFAELAVRRTSSQSMPIYHSGAGVNTDDLREALARTSERAREELTSGVSADKSEVMNLLLQRLVYCGAVEEADGIGGTSIQSTECANWTACGEGIKNSPVCEPQLLWRLEVFDGTKVPLSLQQAVDVFCAHETVANTEKVPHGDPECTETRVRHTFKMIMPEEPTPAPATLIFLINRRYYTKVIVNGKPVSKALKHQAPVAVPANGIIRVAYTKRDGKTEDYAYLIVAVGIHDGPGAQGGHFRLLRRDRAAVDSPLVICEDDGRPRQVLRADHRQLGDMYTGSAVLLGPWRDLEHGSLPPAPVTSGVVNPAPPTVAVGADREDDTIFDADMSMITNDEDCSTDDGSSAIDVSGYDLPTGDESNKRGRTQGDADLSALAAALLCWTDPTGSTMLPRDGRIDIPGGKPITVMVDNQAGVSIMGERTAVRLLQAHMAVHAHWVGAMPTG